MKKLSYILLVSLQIKGLTSKKSSTKRVTLISSSVFRWLVYCQVLGEADLGATNVSLPKIGLVKITFDMTNMTHVTRLSLRHNCLGLLPNEIACMKMLVELHLQHNRLTQLPNAMVGLTNLRILDLSHNEFMRLPAL